MEKKESFNYYQAQFGRLNEKSELYNIKVIDFEGNATNNMTLNEETLEELSALLGKKFRPLSVLPVKNYARTEFRPENDVAEIFAELLGQKFLTQGNIEVIKKLGFTVRLKGGDL